MIKVNVEINCKSWHRKITNQEKLDLIYEKSLTAVDEATAFANESPFPSSEELFSDVYVSYK